MIKSNRAKMITVIGIIILLVVVRYAYLPRRLEVIEYERIESQHITPFWRKYSQIIYSEGYEKEFEQDHDIEIKDGIDYSRYSLLISYEYTVRYVTYFPCNKVGIYKREGGSLTDKMRTCDTEYDEYIEHTYVLYLIQKKYIISSDEYEVTYFC